MNIEFDKQTLSRDFIKNSEQSDIIISYSIFKKKMINAFMLYYN